MQCSALVGDFWVVSWPSTSSTCFSSVCSWCQLFRASLFLCLDVCGHRCLHPRQSFWPRGASYLVALDDKVSAGVVVVFGHIWRRCSADILSTSRNKTCAVVCSVNTTLARRIWTSAWLLRAISGSRVGLPPRRRDIRLFARAANFFAQICFCASR